MSFKSGSPDKVRVAIIGAGISGLAIANGLLNDPENRFDVSIYERDTAAFELERGGYQLRMAYGGIESLKSLTNLDTWKDLKRAMENDVKAPSVVNPQNMAVAIKLADVKVYPKSMPIPRTSLKHALMRLPQERGIVHFDCAFDRYEVVASERDAGEHEVAVHFMHAGRNPPIRADILIAADGSNSKANRQSGINNKVKLSGWTLIQSKGEISPDVYSQLPPTLKSEGANMFLAGTDYSGFAAVYKQEQSPTAANATYSLFWAALIPRKVGERLIEEAGEDKPQLVKLLSSYVSNDLRYDPDGLPFIYSTAPDNVRTGVVTSSFKPKNDWRAGKAANSRVILLGDAIHPMTPGRGMGANQALLDAGNLVKLLRSDQFASHGPPTDTDLQSLTSAFDSEMYGRAFKMVKASEDMSGLDLTTTGGQAKLLVGKFILGTIGTVVTILEKIGLYTPETISLKHPEDTT